MSSRSEAGVVSIAGEDFVQVGEAARRLGLSHNSILRRLKTGALTGFTDQVNGYHYVTVKSIDNTLRLREDLARAATLPGDDHFRSDAEVERELREARAR